MRFLSLDLLWWRNPDARKIWLFRELRPSLSPSIPKPLVSPPKAAKPQITPETADREFAPHHRFGARLQFRLRIQLLPPTLGMRSDNG